MTPNHSFDNLQPGVVVPLSVLVRFLFKTYNMRIDIINIRNLRIVLAWESLHYTSSCLLLRTVH